MSIRIRPESPADADAIREVVTAAFGQPDEAALVDALRDAGAAIVSLVAECDDQIVGHILFSPITIEGSNPGVRIAGLAPVSVAPAQQQKGIGGQLIRTGLEECRQLGYAAVVLLGHPEYYPRFGFQPARTFGLKCAYDAPEEAFMALELVPGALDEVSGMAHYHAAFRTFE